MLKRLMLVIVVGISFAPSVFAISKAVGDTGQIGLDKIGAGATQCEFASVSKDSERKAARTADASAGGKADSAQ